MFGIGGGGVRIPLLFLVGMPLRGAFGVNLFVVPFSSLVGAVSHREQIDWRLAWPVIAGGLIGSVGGALLVGLFSNLVLALLFLFLSVLTGAGVFLDRLLPKFSENLHLGPAGVAGAACVLNLLTAMRGGSGGALFPPLLKILSGDIRRAIATSLVASIFTAVAGALVYWSRGDIGWIPALYTMAGSLAGSRVGSLLSVKTKTAWLEAGLTVTVILFALATVYKAI